MRLEEDTLYLSRRNLQALLAKLDGNPVGSACSLGHPGHVHFWLIAEENDVHYTHPSREAFGGYGIAGPMHPDTEAELT